MSDVLRGKRVVVVVAWAILGGAERSVFDFVRQLRDSEGAQVEVLAFTDERGRFRDAVEELGVAWHSHPLSWHGGRLAKARFIAGLVRRLRRLHPDVIAPYTSRPNVLCGLVWRSTGASLCVWNQQDLGIPTKFSRRLVSRAARNTPLLIANSRAAREHLIASYGAPAERIEVVLAAAQMHAPLDDRGTWRARLGLAESALAVSMLAHLHPGKDHETLLRAWPNVVAGMAASGRDAVLLVAGRAAGTELATKALAFDLDLGRTVRFLGDVSDVGGLLAATDVAVLSSPSESAPHALLESMSAGLPIAATDIAGIREMVGPAQHPYLAPPRDSSRLGEAILALALDADLRRALGDENRTRAFARASVPAPAATAAAIAARLAVLDRS